MVWLESGRWQRGDGGEHLCGLVRLGCGARVAAAAPAHVPSKKPRKLKPGAVCFARRALLKVKFPTINRWTTGDNADAATRNPRKCGRPLPMDEWFRWITSNAECPKDTTQELRDAGFAVVAGPVSPAVLASLAAAYDAAVLGADPTDIGVGRTTTRVHDLVNRGPDFDELYIHKPILGACCSVIGRPFKLSTMLARTLNPNSPAQELHVDFRREGDGWPMVGFILMIDDFRKENGATRFVPGSPLLAASTGRPDEGSNRRLTRDSCLLVGRQVPLSSTTDRCGTDTRRTKRANHGVRYKAPTFGGMRNQGSTGRLACVPRR